MCHATFDFTTIMGLREQGYSDMPAASEIGAIVNMEPEHKLIRSILQNSNLFPLGKLRSSASLMAQMHPEGT